MFLDIFYFINIIFISSKGHLCIYGLVTNITMWQAQLKKQVYIGNIN